MTDRAVDTYAGFLRAIGRMLDTESATRVQISEDSARLTVLWTRGDGRPVTYSYAKASNDAFGKGTWQRRPTGSPNPGDGWEERLRTVGQIMDGEGMRLVSLANNRGLHEEGVVAGEVVHHWFSGDELQMKSLERRSLRRAEPEQSAPWWRQFIS
jgi:hypothetical protein